MPSGSNPAASAPHSGSKLRHWLQGLQILVGLRAATLTAAWFARRRKARAPGTIRSILVVRMDGIGDSVLTLPLIERLRGCLPEARITVVTRENLAPVFRMSPVVDEVLALPRVQHLPRLQLVSAALAALRFARTALKGRHFDAALSPRWDADVSMATLLTVLSGAPVRIGYEDATTPDRLRFNRGFHRAFTHVLPAGPLLHEALRSAALAGPLGCANETPGPRLTPRVSPPQSIDALRQKHPGIPTLAIGLPSGAAARRWPAAAYIAAIETIRRARSMSVVLLSDRHTLTVAESITEAIPDAVHLPALGLQEVAAALTLCDVYLGSDTGIAHMAAAIGCAMVTLTPHPETGDPEHSLSPDRFRPFTDRAIVLRPRRSRPGCEQGCRFEEPHCILEISPGQAAAAVLELLQERA